MNEDQNSIRIRLEDLFATARLYRWCEQTDSSIRFFAGLHTLENQEYLEKLLNAKLESPHLYKEEFIILLILFHLLHKDYSWLATFAHLHLSEKLYENDFNFLIAHLFNNTVPLPKSLTYDITERLFFTIQNIYTKLVADFKKVPYKNGQQILLFMTLHNCRVDLNVQNKELINIILANIELTVPPVILNDIRNYLSKQKPEVLSGQSGAEMNPLVLDDSLTRASDNNVVASSQKPATDYVRVKDENPFTDSDFDKSLPFSKHAAQNASEKKIPPAKHETDDIDKIIQKTHKAENASDNLDNITQFNKAEIDKRENKDKSDAESVGEAGLPDAGLKIYPPKKTAKKSVTGMKDVFFKREKAVEATKAFKYSSATLKANHGESDFPDTDSSPPVRKNKLAYAEFVKGNERGISIKDWDEADLFNLSPAATEKKERLKTPQQAGFTTAPFMTESIKNVSFQKEDIPSASSKSTRRLCFRRFYLCTFLLFLAFLLLLSFSFFRLTQLDKKAAPKYDQSQTIPLKYPKNDNSGNPPGFESSLGTGETNTLHLEYAGGNVYWIVQKGNHFYQLYTYLPTLSPATTPHARELGLLGSLSWQAFMQRMKTLNQNIRNPSLIYADD
ncbi:MAG: hypothetical protein AB1798_18630, partial [Spirochaetota bacterium]